MEKYRISVPDLLLFPGYGGFDLRKHNTLARGSKLRGEPGGAKPLGPIASGHGLHGRLWIMLPRDGGVERQRDRESKPGRSIGPPRPETGGLLDGRSPVSILR